MVAAGRRSGRFLARLARFFATSLSSRETTRCPSRLEQSAGSFGPFVTAKDSFRSNVIG